MQTPNTRHDEEHKFPNPNPNPNKKGSMRQTYLYQMVEVAIMNDVLAFTSTGIEIIDVSVSGDCWKYRIKDGDDKSHFLVVQHNWYM